MSFNNNMNGKLCDLDKKELLLKFLSIETLASSLISVLGLGQGAQHNLQQSATTDSANSAGNNQTNTNTTNTTTSTASGGTTNPQQGQFPRTSRISQLFVPIPMNRSRRVIFRRTSG